MTLSVAHANQIDESAFHHDSYQLSDDMLPSASYLSASGSASSYLFTSPRRRCGKTFGANLNNEFGHIFASAANDIPFIVQITLENHIGIIKSKCVGAILTDTWIITSADCGSDAIMSDNNLIFKVTHFDLDFDHWSSGAKKKDANTSVIRETINVTDIHLTSITKSCSPMLLKLQTPISVPNGVHNSVCLPPNVKIRNEWKGIASGWSSYGDTVIERYLRITQVSVRNNHCLYSASSSSSDKDKINTIKTETGDLDAKDSGSKSSQDADDDADDNIFCVSYLPQVHFYLLPGSPLLTIHEDAMILMGVACGNLTSNLINSSYVYSQSYSRISSYLDLITNTIDTDGKANELLISSSSLINHYHFSLLTLLPLFILIMNFN